MTRITDLVGIKYPIFQGGMAWVADASLAAGVSNAGGLGLIAAVGLVVVQPAILVGAHDDLVSGTCGVLPGS